MIMETLSITYKVQFRDALGLGEPWRDYSAGEMTREQAVKLAGEIFNGEVPTRLVKITRTVEAEPPICGAPPVGSSIGYCGQPADFAVWLDEESDGDMGLALYRCTKHANGLHDEGGHHFSAQAI